MDNLTITVDHIYRGQQRSYGPHLYVAEITFTGNKPWNIPHESAIPILARTLVHHWEEDGEGHMFSPRLKSLEIGEREKLSDEQLGSTRMKVRVHIETPFTD